MTSFWEDILNQQAAAGYRGGFLRSEYDVAIVGGGIIGISTAIELKQRNTDLQVVVIERSFPPRGASTRNAGFACFGSISEIAYDIDLMGADRARDLVRRRLEGLTVLRSRCGDAEIDYEQHGGHEIFLEPHPALDRMDELNALLEPLFQGPAFERRDDLIDHFGFTGVHALVRTPFEGTLHSGKMMLRLWQVAEQLGVEIKEGSLRSQGAGRGSLRSQGAHSVRRGQPSVAGSNLRLQGAGRGSLRSQGAHSVRRGQPSVAGSSLRSQGLATLAVELADGDIEIAARTVVLATNALIDTSTLASIANPVQPKVAPCERSEPPVSAANPLQPKVALCERSEPLPGRGQILMSEEIPDLRLQGSFHMNEGYVYFRNVGNRILLGGGRDRALAEEQTTEFGVTDTIQGYLEELLHTVIAHGKPLTIERRWSGIMGFREDKQPFIGEVQPGLIQAFGCNGMGIALGSSIGAEVANFALHGNT